MPKSWVYFNKNYESDLSEIKKFWVNHHAGISQSEGKTTK